MNTNPFAFEELATSLATLTAYADDGDAMDSILQEFDHLYERALRQPPNYREVTELAGHGLKACDSAASRAAWLLLNIQELEVYGVHTLVWHKVDGEYAAPILDQIALALDVKCELTPQELQEVGATNSLLDVLGVKEGAVWLVQVTTDKHVVNSAALSNTQQSLFRDSVFKNPAISGRRLQTLLQTEEVLQRAFPGVEIKMMSLVLHPSLPDFELFCVERPESQLERIALTVTSSVARSTDYRDKLIEDNDSLWTLPHRLESDIFKGLPPCRGGRTLGILAAMAKRQLLEESLLLWKERDFIGVLKSDFNYDVPRDKVRHDLIDRLVLQGFMRKWPGGYHLMMKGIARYLYCLSKFTTRSTFKALDVLEACRQHREKVLDATGCL